MSIYLPKVMGCRWYSGNWCCQYVKQGGVPVCMEKAAVMNLPTWVREFWKVKALTPLAL